MTLTPKRLCSRRNQIYALSANPSFDFILHFPGKGILLCIVVLPVSFKRRMKRSDVMNCFSLFRPLEYPLWVSGGFYSPETNLSSLVLSVFNLCWDTQNKVLRTVERKASRQKITAAWKIVSTADRTLLG